MHFKCQAPSLDKVGRVVDFSVIKATLCEWLEANWDHKFLAWEIDPVVSFLLRASAGLSEGALFENSLVLVPFNPTAENMALHLLNEVGPRLLEGSEVILVEVLIEETRKCSARASLMGYVE